MYNCVINQIFNIFNFDKKKQILYFVFWGFAVTRTLKDNPTSHVLLVVNEIQNSR